MEWLNYDLKYASARSISSKTGPSLLRAVADFIEEDGRRELLGLNLTYSIEEGDYTAFVLYEQV